LDILRKWGRGDFHPGPKEIVHFAVIRPLLDELRKWDGSVTLVKVKSHTGCLLNERADEQAELGRSDDGPEICPGPQKYGSFWLRVRPAVREYAAECGKPLPRDSAPNRSLLEKVATSNTLRAIKKRSTHFVTDLLHHKTGTIVSRTIRRCRPAEYRVWLRCMTGIYPVQTYLARIRVAKSPLCPHCTEAVPETLTLRLRMPKVPRSANISSQPGEDGDYFFSGFYARARMDRIRGNPYGTNRADSPSHSTCHSGTIGA
jgi:hypothetical protein